MGLPGATPKFNGFTGKYERLAGVPPQFNGFTGKYEMAVPGSSAQFNSFTEKYEMARPSSTVSRANTNMLADPPWIDNRSNRVKCHRHIGVD
jgi:hypothetical protein